MILLKPLDLQKALPLLLPTFKRGEMEYQIPLKGSAVPKEIYRGHIVDIAMENGILKVHLKWCAISNILEKKPWAVTDRLEWTMKIDDFEFSGLPPHPFPESTLPRLFLSEKPRGFAKVFAGLHNPVVITFFPYDGSKLDPAQVTGLVT